MYCSGPLGIRFALAERFAFGEHLPPLLPLPYNYRYPLEGNVEALRSPPLVPIRRHTRLEKIVAGGDGKRSSFRYIEAIQGRGVEEELRLCCSLAEEASRANASDRVAPRG